MLKAAGRSLSHANLESLLRCFDDIDAGCSFSRPVLWYAETVIDGVIRASGHDDMSVYYGDADVLMGDGRGNMRDILAGIHDIPGVSAVQSILYEDFFLDGGIVRHVQITGDAVAFGIMDEHLVLPYRRYGKRTGVIFGCDSLEKAVFVPLLVFVLDVLSGGTVSQIIFCRVGIVCDELELLQGVSGIEIIDKVGVGHV